MPVLLLLFFYNADQLAGVIDTALRSSWHVTFRAQITVKRLAGRRAVDQLNRPNLDDAVAVQRIEPGCLGIDHDFTR